MSVIESLSQLAIAAITSILLGLGALWVSYWRRRGGWLGIPIGTIVGLGTSFNMVGLSLYGPWDLLPLIYGALIAGMMGWRLPRPDAWIALPAAPFIVYALGFVFTTGGADNPTAFYLAAAGVGFMIGAGASALVSPLRARRMRKEAIANG